MAFQNAYESTIIFQSFLFANIPAESMSYAPTFFTTSVDPSLVIITIHYELCPGFSKKYLKFTLKLPHLGGERVMKFTISCLLILQMLLGKDVNGRRRTAKHGNRSPK